MDKKVFPSSNTGAYSQIQMGDMIFEKTTIGAYLKVTVIDPASGLEASVFGPASKQASYSLERLAFNKLRRKLIPS